MHHLNLLSSKHYFGSIEKGKKIIARQGEHSCKSYDKKYALMLLLIDQLEMSKILNRHSYWWK